MNDAKQETVADVLKEWRDMVCYHTGPVHPLNHGAVMLNLDRIEAAWKREKEDIHRLLDNSINNQRSDNNKEGRV